MSTNLAPQPAAPPQSNESSLPVLEAPEQQQPLKQSSKLPGILLTALIALLLLAVGLFALFKDRLQWGWLGNQDPISEYPIQELQTLPPTPAEDGLAPADPAQTINSLLAEISEQFRVYAAEYPLQAQDPFYPSVWWVNEDGYSIGNGEVYSGVWGMSCSGSDYEEKQAAFGALKREAGPWIDTTMAVYGFAKSAANTSSSFEDDSFYDYIQGYENEQFKCVFTADPDCSGAGDDDMAFKFSVNCIDTASYAENEQVQLPYLKDLEIKDQVIQVNDLVGDFAVMTINARRTGAVLTAKKINGKWTKVYAGQDVMPCEIAEQYGVPETIAPSCMNAVQQ